MILFLDFDGVLHPARAVMGQQGPELAGDGSLFMWAEPLAGLLAEHPHVQLVLSTSWARHLPFEQVRDFLPVALRRRVVGSTWHRIQTDPDFSRGLPFSYWRDSTRYQQVKRWVNVHRLSRWAAIDDDAKGWDEPARLVQTHPETGLSDPAVMARLSNLLDLHLSEQRLIDALSGHSRVHTLDEVERDLGLAGCDAVGQTPVDDWLHRQAGPAFDALNADPSSALTPEQVRQRLKRD
jgi:hypothetical protein